MDRLTFQIERIKAILADDKNYQVDSLKIGAIWDICDRTASYKRGKDISGRDFIEVLPPSQSLSQEAVRDEVLEDMEHGFEAWWSANGWETHSAHSKAVARTVWRAALKREPNAAVVQQPLQPVDPERVHAGWNIKGEPVYLDEPAPAAPELEVEAQFSMAKSGQKYEFEIDGKWPVVACPDPQECRRANRCLNEPPCGKFEAMTAPESETPRYDALYRNSLDSNDLRAWKKLAYDLERQHSLAQTEIKGHMRTEDDLKAEVAQLRGFLEGSQRLKTIAQARIAELEKLLIQVREEWYGYTPYSKLKQDIDAALKSRA